MGLLTQDIPLAIELAEEPVRKRMYDFPRHLRRRQVPLRDIGGMNRFVDQHVIPGLVPRRARAGDLLVPLVGPLKTRIDIERAGVRAMQALIAQAFIHQMGDSTFPYIGVKFVVTSGGERRFWKVRLIAIGKRSIARNLGCNSVYIYVTRLYG